ncbi:MAG: UDP-N-acetylglucosamine 2-epimerase (hydrolyzing) [Muribaculaceae bacterium]|nr:UDP-N-acetylglucosamine 2-epimerase (hydrolyzing) [Muribaculaceae bacterium]
MMERLSPYRICVATSTRADWGLLMPLCRALRDRCGVELHILATNMHLLDRYGHTVDEIIADGFEVSVAIHTDVDGDDDVSRAHIMAKSLAGTADALASLQPDAMIILGDRFEMLAIASAAAVMHVSLIHIAGGEVTEGALDDSFRHAITKLSQLHLTATEDYRRRVIQLGEAPDSVINTGAIGVWNAFNTQLMTAEELGDDLGIDFDRERVALVTYHPATNDDVCPAVHMKALLDALEQLPELTYVITAPNNDAGGASLFPLLEEFASQHPENVHLVSSLGMKRYQSLLRQACVVIGNSSSGIVEAPSAGVPTVDIGVRQKGRLAAESVIHCGDSTELILAAIRLAITPEFAALAARKQNPYYQPDTLDKMVKGVMTFLHRLPIQAKKFYDLPC